MRRHAGPNFELHTIMASLKAPGASIENSKIGLKLVLLGSLYDEADLQV